MQLRKLRSRFALAPAAVAALMAALLVVACGKNQGKVYFANLEDGAEVESPFTVEMVAEGLTVEPAANGVRDRHGHFHILVDVPMARSLDPVANDAQHLHFSEGETQATLDLPEGEHTLILQFAKGDHRPYDPQIAQEIRIVVTRRNPMPGEGLPGRGEPGRDGGAPDGDSVDPGAADTAGRATMNPGTDVNVPAVGSGMGGVSGSMR